MTPEEYLKRLAELNEKMGNKKKPEPINDDEVVDKLKDMFGMK